MAAATAVQTTGASAYIQSISGGDYTMGRNDVMVLVDSTVTSTITLPDATKVGNLSFTVVRTVGILTVLTIQGQLGQTINGAATVIIPAVLYSAYTFQSTGTGWVIT